MATVDRPIRTKAAPAAIRRGRRFPFAPVPATATPLLALLLLLVPADAQESPAPAPDTPAPAPDTPAPEAEPAPAPLVEPRRASPLGQWRLAPSPESLHPRWTLNDFTEDAGLEGAAVNDVAFQDDGRVVWAATSVGVKRYDGYQWRAYDLDDGIPVQQVRAVAVDRDQNVWIGTRLGLAKYNPATDRFEEQSEMNARLAGPVARRITQDRDGALWVSADRWPDPRLPGGLTRFHHGTATTYGKGHGLPDDHVYDIFQDSRGVVYALTAKGLARFDGLLWRDPLAEHGLKQAPLPAWSMAESPRHGLVVVTMRGLLNFKNGRWKHFPLPSEICAVVATPEGEVVFPIHDRDSNRILFGYWDGETIRSDYPHFNEILRKWDTHWIDAARLSPDGTVWASSYYGFGRWRRHLGDWRVFHDTPPPLFEDDQRRVWFHDEGRLLRFDGEVWEQAENSPRWLALGGDDSIWCLDERGLHRFHDGEWTFEAPLDPELELDPRRVELDRDGKGVWIAAPGPDRRLVVQHVRDGRAVVQQWDAEPPPADALRQHAVGPHGDLWFFLAADNRHLQLVRAVEGRVQRIETPSFIDISARFWFDENDEHAKEILWEYVPRLFVDSRGRVWLAVMDWLYRRETDGSWKFLSDAGFGRRLVHKMFEAGGRVCLMTTFDHGGRMGIFTETEDGRGWTFRHTRHHLPRLLGLDPRGETALVQFDDLVLALPQTENSPSTRAILGGTLDSGLLASDRSIWLRKADIVYRFQADRNPPRTVARLPVASVNRSDELPVELSALGWFRVRSSMRDLRYSWKIDDGEWSEFRESWKSIPVSGLKAGTHRVAFRAMDRAGNIDPDPPVLEFRVLRVPLQERAWFLPVVAVAFAVLGALAVFSVWAAACARLSSLRAARARQAKQAFLATITHEFRTPLNAILNTARIMGAEVDNDEDRKRLRVVRNAGESLLSLVNNIIDYSIIEAGDPFPLDHRRFIPADLVRKVVESLDAEPESRPDPDRGANPDLPPPAVRVEWRPGVPRELLGDPARVSQVLHNLLRSARSLVGDGNLVLRVSYRPSEPPPGPRPAPPPPLVDGLLTLDRLEHGFLAFEIHGANHDLARPVPRADSRMTISARLDNDGLALVVNQRLVQRMGGRLWIDSAADDRAMGFEIPVSRPPRLRDPEIPPTPLPQPLDKHATLVALAPRPATKPKSKHQPDAQPDPPHAPGSDHGPAPESHRLRILVAEDVEINQRLLAAILKRLGHSVEIASNGAEALQKVADAPQPFDLVLMDIQMPVMDGFEATRRLQRPGFPRLAPLVVAVTAHKGCDFDGEWKTCRFVDVIAKPVQIAELVETLRRCAELLPRKISAAARR